MVLKPGMKIVKKNTKIETKKWTRKTTRKTRVAFRRNFCVPFNFNRVENMDFNIK